jgi:pimeloyl-ACP methyl ester carboxylesterase
MMLNSRTTGSGDQLIIFVHGNSQSLHTWDAVIGEGALGNYQKIAVDLPGHGASFRSERPQDDYTAKGLAGHLNDFLSQYAAKRYILVGASLGTSIIGELNPFPSACKGALLSGAMLSSKGIAVKDMLQPNTGTAANFMAQPSDAETDLFIDHLIYHDDPQLKAQYKEVFRHTDPNLREYLGQSLKVPPVIDKVANLISAHIPLAIVYGAEEKIVRSDYLNGTDMQKWKSQIFKVRNSGHCVELDQPVILASLIEDFARECFAEEQRLADSGSK